MDLERIFLAFSIGLIGWSKDCGKPKTNFSNYFVKIDSVISKSILDGSE
jgi:hypothetical protein